MNENKVFPEMGNDANNNLASNTPVPPVVETPEVPTVDVAVPTEPVMPVETPVVETSVTPTELEEVPTVNFSTNSVEPTPVVETPVEPVSPMGTEPVTTPVVETPVVGATPVAPNGGKPNKKGSLLPVILAVVAVALIGFGVWFLFFRNTNPVKLTTDAFDKLKANVQEIGDVLGEVKAYDKLTQKGEMTVEFSSAYLAEEDYEDYESLVEILDALLLEYDMGVDSSNENLYADLLMTIDTEEIFDLGIVVQDGRTYFHILGKYVDVTDELEQESDTEQVEELMAELEGVDGWYFYDAFTKAFTDSLEKDDFEKTSTKITVDKKDVKVTKHELKITKNNAARIINSTIDNLKKDEKINNIFTILGLDLSDLKAKKSDFEDLEPISINFYAKGSDLLKIELITEYEYEDYWEEDVSYTERTEVSYTFGEKMDVFEIVSKEDGEVYASASAEITIGKNESKVELYEDGTKLATVVLKSSDDTLSLAVNAAIGTTTFEGELKVTEKINGKNVESTIECEASIDTVELFKVVLNQSGTFEETYNKLDLSDAVKYEDLTDEENEEISDYLNGITNFGSSSQEFNSSEEYDEDLDMEW